MDLRSAWERAERELAAINDGAWSPFRVYPDGRVVQVPYGTLYAPGEDGTIYLDEDEDGQVEDDPDLRQEGWAPGGKWAQWNLWTGYTGQYGYSGPIMHPSEILRGGIVRDMVHKAQGEGHPVTYCCLIMDSVPVDMDDTGETNPMGWALAELVEA